MLENIAIFGMIPVGLVFGVMLYLFDGSHKGE